jgi:hypothetical protein
MQRHGALLEQAQRLAENSLATATTRAYAPVLERFRAHCQAAGFSEPYLAPMTMGASFLYEKFRRAKTGGCGPGIVDRASAAI